MILTAILSDYVLRQRSYQNVINDKKELTTGVSYDALNFILEYYSYEWVIDYLLDHKDEDFDFEYDSHFETDQKVKAFLEKHPGIDLKTVFPYELDDFSPEDQKTYVEIIYDRWALRFNELVFSFNLEFMYIFATDNSYENSFFILSGAKEGLDRGKEFGQAYVFGVESKNTEEQIKTFSSLENGVPEATDTHEELFGTDRMLDVLNRNISSAPKELLIAVKQGIDDFVGEAEQFDDVTMLCVDYFGPQPE